VRSLKAKASEYIRRARKDGGVVVVSHGKPTAALIPLDEDTFEDYLIEHNPRLRAAVENSFAEYRSKGGVPIEKVIAETGRELRRK
jgi:prevent-host-death family protein